MSMDVAQLSATVLMRRRELDRDAGEARSISTRGQIVVEDVHRLKSDVLLYERVSGLLNSVGEARQDEAQRKIEALVTRGLQTIFGEELSFHVVSSVRGKSPQTDFMVRSTLANGQVVETPVMESRGGGLAATVGFLLRLVVMLLSVDKQETILCLDETFAMVSAEYLDRLGEFLREVVDKTGVQIVMVTHQVALTEHADVVYQFALDKNGHTKVTAQ